MLHETLRGQKTDRPGTRPGVLKDPEPQLVDAVLALRAAGAQSVAAPLLAAPSTPPRSGFSRLLRWRSGAHRSAARPSKRAGSRHSCSSGRTRLRPLSHRPTGRRKRGERGSCRRLPLVPLALGNLDIILYVLFVSVSVVPCLGVACGLRVAWFFNGYMYMRQSRRSSRCSLCLDPVPRGPLTGGLSVACDFSGVVLPELFPCSSAWYLSYPAVTCQCLPRLTSTRQF